MDIKLFETEEQKAGAETTDTQSTGGGGARVEKAQVKASTEPETGPPDSGVDINSLFGEYTSLVFLSGTGTGNKINKGDRLNILEISESMMGTFQPIEFEDFQWICETKDFKKYLKSTGRKESTWDTNESDISPESHSSGVLNFDEYRKGSSSENGEKIFSYSEYKENSIEESLGNILAPGMTEKGMKFKKKDPGFSGGALTENQRSFLKFYFTKNRFMHGDLRKNFSTSLDLEKMKTGEGNEIQIFTSYIDPSGEKYEESTISFGFRPEQIIRPVGSLTKCVVVGTIFNIAPKVPQGESQGGSPLEKIANSFTWASEQLQDIFSSATGQLFGVMAGVNVAWGIIAAAGAGLLGWRALATFREATSTLKGIQGSIEAASVARGARQASNAKNVGIFKRLTGRIGRFVFYPAKVVQRYLTGSKIVVGSQRAAAFARLSRMRQNTSRLRYATFGFKSAKLAKGAGFLAKASRAGSSLAKISNPIGWALLLTDVAVSAYNYTSDNQAPSWDPMIGDKTDALKNYADKNRYGGNGLCPSATNEVTFSKLQDGKQYTMCWTQGPDSGFGVAMSFIASVSTRTTIDMIKLKDIGYGKDKILSVFIITNVNHKETQDKLKNYGLRLLVFKGNIKYAEGIIDDNISAKLVLANASGDPKDMLPMSYMGHTSNLLFTDTYVGSPDQLVTVDNFGPEEFTFHFEDSESNVINVWGKKIQEKDLENASEEEIKSFFTKEPVSSYIGDPSKETEEEKKQREEIENQALALKQRSQKELEKDGEKESSELASTGQIKTNESILSFDNFKRQKETGFIYEDSSAVQDMGSSTPQDQNFQKILNNSTSPAFFEIYFVTLREYADPSLRKIYSPGSFSNFLLSPEAISASDGSDLSGDISINNYDVLLNVKKGLYNFDGQSERERKEEEEAEKLKGGKSQIEVRSSTRGKVFDLSKTPEKEKEEKKEELEREGGLISKIEKDDIKSLNIGSWGDVTNVKAIRDEGGNIVKIKIKNRKANLDDKSREVGKGDPGFESAIRLYDKYKENTESSSTAEKKS